MAEEPAEPYEPVFESDKSPSPENLAQAVHDMRQQIDGLRSTQQLIMGLLQQLVPTAPKG